MFEYNYVYTSCLNIMCTSCLNFFVKFYVFFKIIMLVIAIKWGHYGQQGDLGQGDLGFGIFYGRLWNNRLLCTRLLKQ